MMPTTGTILLDTGVVIDEDDVRAATEVSSYKCEECGKIIAAPSDWPAPACCENSMSKIR